MFHVWCHKSIKCFSPCSLVKRFSRNSSPARPFEGCVFKHETLEPVGYKSVVFLVFAYRSTNLVTSKTGQGVGLLVTCEPSGGNVKLADGETIFISPFFWGRGMFECPAFRRRLWNLSRSVCLSFRQFPNDTCLIKMLSCVI